MINDRVHCSRISQQLSSSSIAIEIAWRSHAVRTGIPRFESGIVIHCLIRLVPDEFAVSPARLLAVYQLSVY